MNINNCLHETRVHVVTMGTEISTVETTHDLPEPTAPSSYPRTLFVPPIANAS